MPIMPLDGLELTPNETTVIDFGTMFTAHKDFIVQSGKIVPFNRIAAMSLAGWAEIKSRLAYVTARVDVPVSDLLNAKNEVWREFILWSNWSENEAPHPKFQKWLDTTGPGMNCSWRAYLLEPMCDFSVIECACVEAAARETERIKSTEKGPG